MNKLYKNIIFQSLGFKRDKAQLPLQRKSKEYKNAKVEFTHLIHDSFFILIGVISAGFGLKGFLLPNMFIDGGVMGISLTIAELTQIPLSILIVAVNLPFLIMGFSTIGKQFAIKSIISIVLLAITVHFINFPIITDDKLLIAVFGGFFLGLGIGLAIRGGSVIDGTEILAVYISRKISLTIGDVIMILNIFIFGIAGLVFTIETALYAMLTYLAASKTVDFVVSGVEEYVGVTIISHRNKEIRLAILENLGRGCTIYAGKRGQSMENTDVIYTLITRLEIAKLHTEIDKIDKEAFIIMHSIKDAKGSMIKKRAIK